MAHMKNRLAAFLAEKEMHENRRISIKELEKDTQVSKQTLYAWLNNDISRYDERVIINLCQYFKKSVGDLLTIVED